MFLILLLDHIWLSCCESSFGNCFVTIKIDVCCKMSKFVSRVELMFEFRFTMIHKKIDNLLRGHAPNGIWDWIQRQLAISVFVSKKSENIFYENHRRVVNESRWSYFERARLLEAYESSGQPRAVAKRKSPFGFGDQEEILRNESWKRSIHSHEM